MRSNQEPNKNANEYGREGSENRGPRGWGGRGGSRHHGHGGHYGREEMTGERSPRQHRHGGRGGEREGFGPGGFGPGFGPFGGPGGPGGRGAGPRGRGRRRRGDVRLALLMLLKLDGPLNGYQLMQGLEDRSEGRWRPSPGSVYPALSQLEDEGLIKSAAVEGESGRSFELTDAGVKHVDENHGETKAPWESEGESDDSIVVLWKGFAALGRAAKQISSDGDPQQIAKAADLISETRKALYRILSGDDAS